MAAENELRYWDSCCFLRHFEKHPDNANDCQTVLDNAAAGKLQIVTSTLTLAEVIKVKGETPLPSTDSPMIDAFFKHKFIIVRQLDRLTGELARRLVWAKSIDPKDAVHVATALIHRCTRMDTTDGKLIRKGPIEFAGYGPLEIKPPTWDHPVQLTIDSQPPA